MLRLFIIASLVGLSACSTGGVRWDPDDYSVRSGDTLYSIAWRYELDPFELARWNHLSSPYRIHPGDRLHTNEADSIATAKSRQTKPQQTKPRAVEPKHPVEDSPGGVAIRVKSGDTIYSLAKRYNIAASELAAINGLRKPYVIHPGQKLRLKGKLNSTTVASHTKPTKTVKKIQPQSRTVVDTNRKVSWRWPVQGKITQRFNKRRTDAKGINIAGREGAVVKAAATGKVVYSGNGLISYGNLIIIKHSRTYLSAYAHNRKLLVKEGQTVKVGQKIAELGKTGTEKPHLHFEIRKLGKPVDPLRYLPSS